MSGDLYRRAFLVSFLKRRINVDRKELIMNELRTGEAEDRAGGKLYLAFELGNKEWKLGFTVGLA